MTDIKRIDKITSTQKAAQRDSYYSDFFTDFEVHPDTGNLLVKRDADSVKQAIRNLILTNKGERFFNIDLGCNIENLLFEPMTSITTENIKTYIEEAIARFEPRVNVQAVVVSPNEQQNLYNVSILFEIINNSNPVTLAITLYRVR